MFYVCFWEYFILRVVGFNDLVEKVGSQLERPKKKYSSRNQLHRRMLSFNPLFKDFVTGAKRGSGDFFFCRVCKRDVKMGSHGSSEIIHHYESKKHWEQDVVWGCRSIIS